MSSKKQYVLLLLVLIVAIFDRYFWSGLSTWREDEATVMWMAEYITQDNLIYGLLNSRHIPNPNGMPLAAKLFSPFSSLRWINFSLHLFTLFSAFIFSKIASKKHWLSLFTMLASLIIIRNNCGDLWAQAILLPFNFILASMLLIYSRYRKWTVVSITALIALIPFTFYLAGIPIVLAAALVTLISLFIFPPETGKKDITIAAMIFIIGIGLSVHYVWYPYFANVDFEALTNQSRPTLIVGQGYRFLEQIILLPFSLVFRVMEDDFAARTFYSTKIFPAWTTYLGLIYEYFFKVQAFIWGLGLIQIIYLFFQKTRPRFSLDYLETFKSEIRKLDLEDLNFTIILVFIAFCGGFTPAMGGFRWTSGARLDLLVPFIPFFCYFIFFKFFPKIRKYTLPVFIIFNTLAGFYFLHFQYHYKGNFITGADEAIIYKEKLVDYMALDWKRKKSNEPIPAHYDLGGPYWGFIPSITPKYDERFNNCYTIGRAFDFMLKKRHGLDNAFEGQIRDKMPEGARYIINYTYQKPYPGITREVLFNRLRLNIYE